MRAKTNGLCGALWIVCLAAAGCGEPPPEPTPLGAEMTRQLRLAVPTVGGPSEEFFVGRKPAEIAAAIATTLKGAGVRVAQEGHSDAGQWFYGKSLADRGVLVQVLPVYPGRSTVKVTVEGGDTLTRELLTRLAADLSKRLR